MRYLFIGIAFSLLAVIIAFALDDWSLLYKITSFVGVFCIVFGSLLSEVFISGEQMARNLNSESKVDREQRMSLTSRLMLIGAPNIIIAILFYFLIK
jgi:hypothetical protein